jgi:hypothetical protein
LEKTICSPERLRIRVVFSPMYSTVPSSSPTITKSPITNGLSSTMESEPKRSPSTFCTASATAIPPTPSPARSGVTWMPRFASTMSSRIVQRNSRPMKPSAFSVVAAAASSWSRCFTPRETTCMMTALPHRPACSATATTTTPRTSASTFPGSTSHRIPNQMATMAMKKNCVRVTSRSGSPSCGVSPAASSASIRDRSRRRVTRFARSSTVIARPAASNAPIQALNVLSRNV